MSEPDIANDDALWPHTIRFDEAYRGLEVTFEADEARRDIVRQAFGMTALHSLRVKATLTPRAGRRPSVMLRLHLEADVTQECGVSLEPFRHAISDTLDLEIVERRNATGRVAEIGAQELGLTDLDEPDVSANGLVDLGQYAIETLGFAYDPFARKPGVEFEEPPAEAEPSPFSVLATLKTGE